MFGTAIENFTIAFKKNANELINELALIRELLVEIRDLLKENQNG